MLRLSRELWRRSPVLVATGWLHLGLFFVALILSLVDERLVMGINVWIKPMKFMVSITVYLWTVAWFIDYLPRPKLLTRVVAWGASMTMVVETLCLWVQAGRGTYSHYNISTAFDGAIFGTMGIMILINSLMALLLFGLFLQGGIKLPRVYLWGIRMGLAIFLLGSLEGTVMISNSGHAVGVRDGGPGLPFLNWSVEGGDLRIAHMLGLHALQVIPFFACLLVRKFSDAKLTLLSLFSALYVLLLALAYWKASAGTPLISV